MKFDGTDFNHNEWQKIKHGRFGAFLIRTFFSLSEAQHQSVFDQLAQLVLSDEPIPEAFLVVGGYGRQQASKISDLDLIGISRSKIGDEVKAKTLIQDQIHKRVSLLEWLNLKQSNRTIQECLSKQSIFTEHGFVIIDPKNILN